MTKEREERIRKLEKRTDELEELLHRTLTSTQELLKIVEEDRERLGLLEKAHNEIVDWCGNHMGLNHDLPKCYESIKEMCVEEKT